MKPLLLYAALLLTAPAQAADDHGHSHDAPAATTANGPQRLPDGSVFLPKPAQRQIALRTLVTEAGALPRTVTLNGQVVMDPNAGGQVQPTAAGRIEPGPAGLPAVGQAVRKGQVLAYVRPSAGSIERSNQTALLADLRAQQGLADKRLARLQALADTVPRREIEAAQSERDGLAARIGAVDGGLGMREALLAPVAGVIASAHAVSGQVVEPRELLFEIVDPTRLRVEALTFDAGLADNIAGASLAMRQQTNERIALTLLGASRILRDQALPLLFRAQGAGLAQLAVGQSVQVVVQTRSQVQGVPVPAAALQKNPSNQNIVWVKAAPERFEPRVVVFEPLDGSRIAVTSGLKAGERVVTQGAALVNQIR